MGEAENNEGAQAFVVEAQTEINRPQKLYRGFISNGRDESAQIASSDSIQTVLAQGLNPHDKAYADQFIWTTPDQNYAQSVVTMRFLIKMSTDPTYSEAIRSGATDNLPSLATYDIKPQTVLFGADGNKLAPLGKDTKQIILDQVAPEDYHVAHLNEQSRDILVQELDRPLETGDADTVYKATFYLDKMTQSDFTGAHNNNFENQTWSEVIREATQYYEDKGVERPQINDLLAKGMHAGALELRELANTAVFE